MSRLSLEALNGATASDFVALLEGIYEHSPWIAERAAATRPHHPACPAISNLFTHPPTPTAPA